MPELNPAPAIEKIDLPLDCDQQMLELVEQFEACTLPIANWTHRAHLAVGVVYLDRLPFDVALARIRQRINDFNRTRGNPLGYNETVTVLFLRKIASVLSQKTPGSRLHTTLAELERICSVNWIYEYYSKQLVWSNEAKADWQEPDKATLDF